MNKDGNKHTAALRVEGMIKTLVRRKSEFGEVTVSQRKFNQSYGGQKLIYKNQIKPKKNQWTMFYRPKKGGLGGQGKEEQTSE